VSFNLNLQSQCHWSLFNRTWQKRPTERDHRLRFEIEEMTLRIQQAVPVAATEHKPPKNNTPQHIPRHTLKHILQHILQHTMQHILYHTLHHALQHTVLYRWQEQGRGHHFESLGRGAKQSCTRLLAFRLATMCCADAGFRRSIPKFPENCNFIQHSTVT